MVENSRFAIFAKMSYVYSFFSVKCSWYVYIYIMGNIFIVFLCTFHLGFDHKVAF